MEGNVFCSILFGCWDVLTIYDWLDRMTRLEERLEQGYLVLD